MYKCSILDKISFILVIFGSLNWGVYGLFNLDLIYFIFGGLSQLVTRIIYVFVGMAGVDMILFLIKSRSIRSESKI